MLLGVGLKESRVDSGINVHMFITPPKKICYFPFRYDPSSSAVQVLTAYSGSFALAN